MPSIGTWLRRIEFSATSRALKWKGPTSLSRAPCSEASWGRLAFLDLDLVIRWCCSVQPATLTPEAGVAIQHDQKRQPHKETEGFNCRIEVPPEGVGIPKEADQQDYCTHQ